MLCAKCGHSYRVGSRFCQNCGAPIAAPSDSPVASIGDELAKITDELSSSLKSTSDQLSTSLRGSSSFSRTGLGRVPGLSVNYPTPAAAAPTFAGEDVLRLLLSPTKSDLDQSASFTFTSPFIQGNTTYRERIGKLTFAFDANNWQLNAFATDHTFSTKDGRKVPPPAVFFMAGMDTAIRLVALALSAQLSAVETRALLPGVSILAKTFHQLGQAVVKTGEFSVDTAITVFADSVLPYLERMDEHTVSLGRSYVAAMESFIIAHEAGHLALSHTLGGRPNLDVSRNQEREADSFAASALSACPFRDYLFLGCVFGTIIIAWVDAAGGRPESTHPLGRERFENALRSNSAAAAEAAERFGFTRERLTELLPAG